MSIDKNNMSMDKNNVHNPLPVRTLARKKHKF